MWTPQCGEKKGGLCFVKRKDKSFLSNEKSFIERKWGENLGWTRCMRKVVDFLSILLCFGGKTLSFSDEIRVFVFRSSLPVCFLTRAGVPERTRARASRTQRV